MSEEVYAGAALIQAVEERQFRILYETAVYEGLSCPPKEFQPDDDEDGRCRLPFLATDDTCMLCWREYTRIQALLDLGLVSRMEHEDEDIKKADRAGTVYEDEERDDNDRES